MLRQLLCWKFVCALCPTDTGTEVFTHANEHKPGVRCANTRILKISFLCQQALSWHSARAPPEGSVVAPPPPPPPEDVVPASGPRAPPAPGPRRQPPPPPQRHTPVRDTSVPSGAHPAPETSTAPEQQQQPPAPDAASGSRSTQRLTPDRMKKLGLPSGMDLRNTDV